MVQKSVFVAFTALENQTLAGPVFNFALEAKLLVFVEEIVG